MNFRSTMKSGILTFLISFTIVMTLSDVGAERIKLLPDSLVARGEELVIGREAGHGEFPFHVSIQIIGEQEVPDGHICGGSILDENTVLTAAHCFDYVLKRGYYEIVAGNKKLKGPHEKEQRRKIDQVFIHPSYSDEEEGSKCDINDIAIIRVRAPFIFNDFVNAARLPDADVYPIGYAQVSGWGAMAKGQPGSEATLQVAELPLLSPMECEAALEDCVGGARTLLCTNPRHGVVTLFEGDGGGPLFQGEVVMGIVSLAEEDRSSALAIYTRVSAYRKWIDSKLTSRTNSNSKVQNEL